MLVRNLSSKQGAASTNLTTPVCRACPELKPLAAQTIKLVGQVLHMISINCIIDKIVGCVEA